MTETTDSIRVIKKYPNRRLYDTACSRYVTLTEVRQLVIDGIPFMVREQKTGEDITRSILLQIIMEQESEEEPLFTNEHLERFIRYYGSMPQQGFSEFMANSLQFFHDQQAEFGKAMEDLAAQNPMTAWADMAQKNMDTWSKMMGLGDKPSKTDKK